MTKKKLFLSLHYNGAYSYLFINGKKIVKFKAKDSAIVATPLYLRNISKDWSVNNVKRTGLNGYVYKFSVDYMGPNPHLGGLGKGSFWGRRGGGKITPLSKTC